MTSRGWEAHIHMHVKVLLAWSAPDKGATVPTLTAGGWVGLILMTSSQAGEGDMGPWCAPSQGLSGCAALPPPSTLQFPRRTLERKPRAVRRRYPSTWELLFSQQFSAVIRAPWGSGEHSDPVGPDGEAGRMAYFRLLAAPLPGEVSPSADTAVPSVRCTGPRGLGTQEDDVRDIINDLLTGKQSSQGLLHDLPAIMPSAAHPGPLPLCGGWGPAQPLPAGHSGLWGSEAYRQVPARLGGGPGAANDPPHVPLRTYVPVIQCLNGTGQGERGWHAGYDRPVGKAQFCPSITPLYWEQNHVGEGLFCKAAPSSSVYPPCSLAQVVTEQLAFTGMGIQGGTEWVRPRHSLGSGHRVGSWEQHRIWSWEARITPRTGSEIEVVRWRGGHFSPPSPFWSSKTFLPESLQGLNETVCVNWSTWAREQAQSWRKARGSERLLHTWHVGGVCQWDPHKSRWQQIKQPP